MNRLVIFFLLILAAFGTALTAPQPPNIVVILVDDMGFSDIGCVMAARSSRLTSTRWRLRHYKHFNHEGGIATPLIVHWPDRVKTPGQLRQQPGHMVDILATCVDVAGAKYPAEFHGKPIEPMEGKSLLPAMEDKLIERDAIYWEHEGNATIREGDWKLVRLGRNGPWELYNLKTDRTELHDLASVQLERAAQLAA